MTSIPNSSPNKRASVDLPVAEAIKEEMQKCGPNLQALQQLALPAIGGLMLVHRYAYRYVQMDKNWGSERDDASLDLLRTGLTMTGAEKRRHVT